MVQFKNPWSHKDSPWYNEEKDRWYNQHPQSGENNPGRIPWKSNKSKKVAHMFNWIRYENRYGDGYLDLRMAFEDIDTGDAGMMGNGFYSNVVELKINNQTYKAALDFSVYRNYQGKVHTKIDIQSGGMGQFYRGDELWDSFGSGSNQADFRFSAPSGEQFNFLYNWLGYEK